MPVMRRDVGGLAASYTAALDDSPGILVKATQGLLFGWHIKNTTGAALYVQIFDVAALASVTLGTTVPYVSLGLAANASSSAAFPVPIACNNGIAVFSTTTAGGNTGAASDCVFFYA